MKEPWQVVVMHGMDSEIISIFPANAKAAFQSAFEARQDRTCDFVAIFQKGWNHPCAWWTREIVPGMRLPRWEMRRTEDFL